MKSIFSVDPGVSGAIAFTDGKKTSALAMGDDEAVRDFIEQNVRATGVYVAYMELVGGFIGKEESARGSHMFTFGDSYGFVRGLFKMAQIPLILVRPQVWIRNVLPGSLAFDYNERKRALKAYAQSLHPGIEVTLKTADALALLEYARRKEAGELQSGSQRVVKSSGDYCADAKAAIKWAKSEGWPIAKRGSAVFVAMVNYYCQHIR